MPLPAQHACLLVLLRHRAHRIRLPIATPRRPLSLTNVNVTVLSMYTLARFLQIVGLTIPLLAIIAQLNQQITLSQMLGFLIVSVGVFMLGYLLQRYTGSGPS